MQATIAQSAPPVNKPLPDNEKHSPPENVTQTAPPGGVSPTIIEAVPATQVSSSSTEPFHNDDIVGPPLDPVETKQSPPENVTQSAPPGGVPTIIEAVPTTQVSITNIEPCGKLPPPPPLDSLETYSFVTSDSHRKTSIDQESRKWRRIVCLASILLLVVAAAVVVSVVLVFGNKHNQINNHGGEATLSPPTPAPSLRPPTTQEQVPTVAPFAAPIATPIVAPIAAPTVGTDSPLPNVEQLTVYFANKNQDTEIVLSDTTSPQYRAMRWLAEDVE
jgi:hypothetical protein